MKTRKTLSFGIIAVLITLAFTACPEPIGDIPVTFSSVSANGSASQTTTQLTLTFSEAITGLSADDITLSGSTGAQKGSLTSTGTAGVYELAVSGITASGQVTVVVSKSGYVFNPSS